MEEHREKHQKDVKQLQEMIASQRQQLTAFEQQRQQYILSLKEKDQEITYLKSERQKHVEEIADLRFKLQKALMHRYGQGSEKFSSEQLNVFDEPEVPHETETQVIQAADEAITIAFYTRKKSGRKPLPADLPREQIVYDLREEEKVCACGHALHRIGEDISEKLEFIPAQVKIIQHVRCKYACRACEGAVKMAALPAQPIPKSIASPGLLAHVLVSKYEDHLPLYRQEQLLQRMGIDIARYALFLGIKQCRCVAAFA